MSRNFKPGDEVRGKDTAIRGKVLKVLDEKWLMVLETEHNMEINLPAEELVKVEITGFDNVWQAPLQDLKPAKRKSRSYLVLDIHWEKIPSGYKNHLSAPLSVQLEYLDRQIAAALQEGYAGVRIIHGKGSGVLRKEVISLLRSKTYIKGLKTIKAALEPAHGTEISF
jgi:DNA mismatch repair protein MutS2